MQYFQFISVLIFASQICTKVVYKVSVSWTGTSVADLAVGTACPNVEGFEQALARCLFAGYQDEDKGFVCLFLPSN